jgi:DNA-directed RNA polymerase specialized sigma24 family protein
VQTLSDKSRHAAGLHWLAHLLTGQYDLSVDVVADVTAAQAGGNPYFSNWMEAWSRRIVIAKALAAIRHDLAASALRTKPKRLDRPALPQQGWVLDGSASRSELERALLSIDVFPRAAVVLSVFERVPAADVAVLLDADIDLVRKAQAIGLRELTTNLARMQGWKPVRAARIPANAGYSASAVLPQLTK